MPWLQPNFMMNVGQDAGGLRSEMQSGPPVLDGFDSTALSVTDDGTAASLRLHRRHAEVLHAGENEGATAPIQAAQRLVGHLTGKFDVRGSASSKVLG